MSDEEDIILITYRIYVSGNAARCQSCRRAYMLYATDRLGGKHKNRTKSWAKCFRGVGEYCSPNCTLGTALPGAGAAAAQHSKGGRGSSPGGSLPTRTTRRTQTTTHTPDQEHAKGQGTVAQHTQKQTSCLKPAPKNKRKAKCA